MKDDSKVYIVTAGKSSQPLGVSGSLVNLFENLGVRGKEDPKPFYQAFKTENKHPLKVGDQKLTVHCLRLKDQISL